MGAPPGPLRLEGDFILGDGGVPATRRPGVSVEVGEVVVAGLGQLRVLGFLRRQGRRGQEDGSQVDGGDLGGGSGVAGRADLGLCLQPQLV